MWTLNTIKKSSFGIRLVSCLFCFVVPSFLFATVPDSLQKMLQFHTLHNNEIALMNTYLAIGRYQTKNEKSFEALESFRLALTKAEILKETEVLLECLFYVGQCHQKLNNYSPALEYFLRYLEEGAVELSIHQKGNVNSAISVVYKAQGDFDLAYAYQLKALELQEAAKDSVGIAKSLYDIGSIFFYQDNYVDALKYYEQTMLIAQRINKPKMIYNCLGALGSTHNGLKNYEKAMELNLQSLDLARKIDYKKGLAYALHNVGVSFDIQEKYLDAIEYLEESLHLKKELGDKWGEIGSLIALANPFLELGNTNQALIHLDSALEIAREVKSKTRILDIYKHYAIIYERTNHPLEAIKYLQEYIDLKDTMINANTLEEMSERKSHYEIHKKEKEIILLKKEKQVKTLSIYFGVAILFFLGLVVFLIWKQYQKEKKINVLMGEKSDEISRQNRALAETNQLVLEINRALEDKNQQIEIKNGQLEDSNKELENFAYVASHDLKEPLRMIKSYTGLLKRRYDHLFDDNAKEFMFYVTDAVGRMENLLTDLLAYSRVGTNQIPPEQVSTRDIMAVVQSMVLPRLEKEHMNLQVNYGAFPVVQGSKTQLTQLFQNLLTNAFKFQPKHRTPEVVVNCKKNGRYYIFSIKDNGIGIAPEHQKQIFEMFRRLHSREEFEGTGIGLATCKKIVNRHGGDIWVESEVGEGSTFYFTMPFPNPN